MSKNYPPVGLSHTEERSLFSTRAGRAYQLAVLLPENYAASGRRYPVVYLLDGDLAFGMAAIVGHAPGPVKQVGPWITGMPPPKLKIWPEGPSGRKSA